MMEKTEARVNYNSEINFNVKKKKSNYFLAIAVV